MASKRTERNAAGNMKKETGVGLVIAGALAATALGAYYLSGTEGKKRKQQIKGWMLKAKGEVLDQVEKAKELDREVYERIVDGVAERYSKVKSIDVQEVGLLMNELRGHWNKIKRDWKKAAPVKKAKAKGAAKPKAANKSRGK
jgi:hypothetical protein